ncbi:hypothetical protein GCM10025779_03210 [Arthrobacter cryoconiti]
MGRRSVKTMKHNEFAGSAALLALVVAGIGFVLEIAMLAGLLYWGFGQHYPWNLVFGIGIPAVVVVLWGIFMAPRSERRLPEAVVSVLSLGMFLLAGLALLVAGTTVYGIVMLSVSVAWYISAEVLRRRLQR